MTKPKNIISKVISIILSALFLFIIIKAMLHRDYPTLIKSISVFVGFGFYQAVDSKIIKPFRTRVKNQDLFNAIIWITSIVFIITNFIFFVLSHNKSIESVYSGLIYPSVYFSVKYWDLWMEDNEIGNSE